MKARLVAVCVAVALAAPANAAGVRAGCDASRPAVAYTAGGGVLSPQPAQRPIPCLEVVPDRTSESAMVAVAPSGRIFYAPLVENSDSAPLDDRGPARVLASDDGGVHWQALDSGGSDHVLQVPPWMTRDRQTGRLWLATVLPSLCGTELSWSDDDGRTWHTNPTVGCPSMGALRTLEGPAPSGASQPSGYPHVVYVCANASDLSPSTVWCYKSLDGGNSFAFTGAFPDPPPRPGCNAQHPARPGTVGPDGALYFPVYLCGDLLMAVSRDEGATWQDFPVATTNVQDLYISSVATDDAGNVYLAWIGSSSTGSGAPSAPGSTAPPPPDARPMLSISRDHGRTWSKPVVVSPPGVGRARRVAIAAEGVGRLALSYLANRDGSSSLDGYLSETADALAPEAVWWAAPLNDPATPLISTDDSETFGDRLFNFETTFAPDGEPWAAFHCAKTATCPGRRIGVIGRLSSAPAPAARSCTSRRIVRFRVPRRAVRVTASAGRITVRHRRATLDLRGLGRQRVTVRIRVRRARTVVRRFRTCTAGASRRPVPAGRRH